MIIKKWLIGWWFVNLLLIVALLGDVIYHNFSFKIRDYSVAVYFIIWSIIVFIVYIKKTKF